MTDRTTKETFLAAYGERERRGALDGPAWLREARRAAIDRFAERGLPTTRDEDWKYTSIAPLVATPLRTLIALSRPSSLPRQKPALKWSPAPVVILGLEM